MLLSLSFWYVYEPQGILFLRSTFKIKDVFLVGEINTPYLSWGFPSCLSFPPRICRWESVSLWLEHITWE